jgi:hypothetical protein
LHGDAVAPETFVQHLDRISLFALVSSTLLLVVAGWQIPADPDALASVCRSRPQGAAATPVPARPGTRRAAP